MQLTTKTPPAGRRPETTPKPRGGLLQLDAHKWKARQRSPRPILGAHRCGGRFLL